MRRASSARSKWRGRSSHDDHSGSRRRAGRRCLRPSAGPPRWPRRGLDGVRRRRRRPILRVPGTPGSRYSLRPDRTPWMERGLRVIMTERPGYGASTRLEGRGFVEHPMISPRSWTPWGSIGSRSTVRAARRHISWPSPRAIHRGSARPRSSSAGHRPRRRSGPADRPQCARLPTAPGGPVRGTLAAHLGCPGPDPGRSARGAPEHVRVVHRRRPGHRGGPGWQRGIIVGDRGSPPRGTRRLVRRRRRHGEPVGLRSGGRPDRRDVVAQRRRPECAAVGGSPPRGAPPACATHVWEHAGHLTPYLREPEVLDELLARG